MAFLDETSRDPTAERGGYYQLTAVLVDDPSVTYLRTATTATAPNNGFHASDLNHQRRHAEIESMLHHVAAADSSWSLVVTTYRFGSRAEQEPARARCLREMLTEADKQQVRHLVLDSREATSGDPQARNKHDLATLAGLRSAGQVSRHMTLEHKHDDAEPLLWIPDAVGWAFRAAELRGDSRYWDIVCDVTTVLRA